MAYLMAKRKQLYCKKMTREVDAGIEGSCNHDGIHWDGERIREGCGEDAYVAGTAKCVGQTYNKHPSPRFLTSHFSLLIQQPASVPKDQSHHDTWIYLMNSSWLLQRRHITSHRILTLCTTRRCEFDAKHMVAPDKRYHAVEVSGGHAT